MAESMMYWTFPILNSFCFSREIPILVFTPLKHCSLVKSFIFVYSDLIIVLIFRANVCIITNIFFLCLKAIYT